MSGFEYAATATIIQQGMVEPGLEIVEEISKRYDLNRWSVLLALQGFTYDGPAQTIGFAPLWKPENHASFFTTSSA